LQRPQATKPGPGPESISIPVNKKSKATKATRSHILNIAFLDVFILFAFIVHTSITEVRKKIWKKKIKTFN